MTNIIERLQAYDIPHTSYLKAIRHMREHHGEMNTKDAYVMIHNLCGSDNVQLMDGFDLSRNDLLDDYIRLILYYLIQESIRASFTQDVVNGLEILPLAVKKTQEFMAENPWVFAKPDVEDDDVDQITNKPKFKKGKKQQRAVEIYRANADKDKQIIMELFQTELNMSKSGARTYYYNMKHKFENEEMK